jgi:hypothetical protein
MTLARHHHALADEPINLHKSADDRSWGRAKRTQRLLARMAKVVDEAKEGRLNGRLPLQ